VLPVVPGTNGHTLEPSERNIEDRDAGRIGRIFEALPRPASRGRPGTGRTKRAQNISEGHAHVG
jgi:hypothetical protein